MFDALFDGLAWLLDFFYTYAGRSYGLAIALLTLTVMVLCFPLTAKATRGMAAMSKLQPELKKIQQKHKDDRQKQSEETMALFKEHKVSPAGGCLPMLVQAPIFFIMYRVLIGLTHRGEDGTFEPKYLSPESTLYRALDNSRSMKSFGVDLAENAGHAVKASFVGALPFLMIIAAVVATGYYQQRQMIKRNPQSSANDNPYMQSMQRMSKIFPLMYLVFGFTLPAGLNIYFLVSNLFRIGQQALIYKMNPDLLPTSANSPVVEAKSKSVEGKPAKGESAKSVDGKGSGAGKPALKPEPSAGKGKPGAGAAKGKGGGAEPAKSNGGARAGGKAVNSPPGKAGKPSGSRVGGPGQNRPGRNQPKKARRGR